VKVARLDQLIPSVKDKLPASPLKGQAIRSLREAAQRFCFETEAWKEALPSVNTVANQTAYTLATSWQAEIRRIHSVYLKTAAEVTSGAIGTEHDVTYDTFSPATSVYRFGSAPASTAITGGLVFTVVLVPNLQADEIPEWLLGLYGMAFVYGAIADLCSHKGAGGMYDPETAKLYAMKYSSVKNNVMAEAFRGTMNASPSIQPLYNLAGAFSNLGYRVGG
jgi:hypothetical protein